MRPFTVKSILAPTDLTESSLPALRYAHSVGERFGAPVTVMYAEPAAYPASDSLPPEREVTPERRAAMEIEVEEHSRSAMGSLPYAIEIAGGSPVSAILAAVREKRADLVVMGTHLRHGWRRAVLGSVSEGVLQSSPAAVMTVARNERRNVARNAVTRVLCPVNYTDVSSDSLAAAVVFSQVFAAHLTVVHVQEGGDSPVSEERLYEWVLARVGGWPFQSIVERGGAAERVLDVAEETGTDLIVAGAQQKLFRDAVVIGTTTERLVRFAPCPVLVIPRADAETLDAERVVAGSSAHHE